jgi:heme o synthase
MERALSPHRPLSTWRDYPALAKPRVVALHLVTAAAAMFLAAKGLPSILVLAATLLGGGLVAGASNALNCYLDRDIDKLMARTRNRPLPAGRLSPFQALTFSGILALAGLFILSWFVSWMVAGMAAIALAYYILVYTLWLKRRTFWSSIIGSGVGGFPPLIGWLAVTGRIEITPFILFIIIALWTPSHFWSLAMYRSQDYQLAGLGVIPARNTARWIAVFSVPLVLVSFWLSIPAHMGLLYSISALLLGIVLIILVALLQINKDSQIARLLYWYSIFYLLVLFGAMLADRLIS